MYFFAPLASIYRISKIISTIKPFEMLQVLVVPYIMSLSHCFFFFSLTLSVRGGWLELITLWVTCSVIAAIDLWLGVSPVTAGVCVAILLSGNCVNSGCVCTARLFCSSRQRRQCLLQ